MDRAKIVTQLHRIEGQVRGIATMIETERGLVPTMQQLMAVQGALRKAMQQYIRLFLQEKEGGVELTKEQIEYILRLIDS